MEALEGTPLSWEDMRNEELNKYYVPFLYFVKEGDDLEQLAQIFRLSTHHIMAWNELTSPDLRPGQPLIIYHIKEVKRYLPEQALPSPSLPSPTPVPAQTTEPELGTTPLSEPFVKGKYLCYRSNGLETLAEIIRRVDGVSLQDIIELNHIQPDNIPEPGEVIRLKKL